MKKRVREPSVLELIDSGNYRCRGDGGICDDYAILRGWAERAYKALKETQTALNTAPRFKVPALECDSYYIASTVDDVLRAAEEE